MVKLAKFGTMLLVLLSIGGVVVLNALSEPSNSSLEQDLADVRSQIEAARNEADRFKGGLILSLAQTRVTILTTTEAMLDQKHRSIIRFIDLRYTIDGKSMTPATGEVLAMIERDMSEANVKLNAAMSESEKYSGGLLKVLSETNAAAERIKISMLELRYLSAKWGIPIYEWDGVGQAHTKQPESIGNVVGDEGAL